MLPVADLASLPCFSCAIVGPDESRTLSDLQEAAFEKRQELPVLFGALQAGRRGKLV
jgi:hypothetical protein